MSLKRRPLQYRGDMEHRNRSAESAVHIYSASFSPSHLTPPVLFFHGAAIPLAPKRTLARIEESTVVVRMDFNSIRFLNQLGTQPCRNVTMGAVPESLVVIATE